MVYDFVYDIETFPNCFTITFEHSEHPLVWQYEISEFVDQRKQLFEFIKYLITNKGRMIGFNNIGFDYPVVHSLLRLPTMSYSQIYKKAMDMINDDEDRFQKIIYDNEQIVPQIDLFKIHHFDNRARSTSLKVLEFNMQSEKVEGLPFISGISLNKDQIKLLKEYNAYDVQQTKKFYHKSKDMLDFRISLSKEYKRNFINHNDTKIGKDFFIMQLEKSGIQCFRKIGNKKEPIQTKRLVIRLRDAILPWITFENNELNRILNWLKDQELTETKNVFKGLAVTIDGFWLIFGTGGIHGSLNNQIVEADDEHIILDLDVSSYYPNLAIQNEFYPQHLGKRFCEIYKSLYEQRKTHEKGSPINAILKLALNGVYGDSNNPYSAFYDPLFTMKITLNGQLLLCMLAEKIMKIGELIQINTDGLTVKVKKIDIPKLESITKWWMNITKLNLEEASYKCMWIRDVNNYLAQYDNGKLKRKGDYEYNLEWHQNHSALIIPKIVEKILMGQVDNIKDTLRKWDNVYDFMLRTKVPRSSYLYWGDTNIQNVSRYYVSTDGDYLFKAMPPLKGDQEWRRMSIHAGYKVTICNTMPDKLENIDYSFYQEEIEKLVFPLKKGN